MRCRGLVGGAARESGARAGALAAHAARPGRPGRRSGGRRRSAGREAGRLGLKQFGHRIKKKPRCSVTIEIPETGEIYRFTP